MIDDAGPETARKRPRGHNKPRQQQPFSAAEAEAKRQKLSTEREALPLFTAKQALLHEVSQHDTLIIVGETGSGKTTQIPQYLSEAGMSRGGVIACTQPRRVAAVTVARRVAEEMGVRLGEQVGYSIRFEDCTSDKTIIKYMTDGMLLREALVDPLLSRYKVVIVDEAHERSVHTDVLLGLLKQVQHRRQKNTKQQQQQQQQQHDQPDHSQQQQQNGQQQQQPLANGTNNHKPNHKHHHHHNKHKNHQNLGPLKILVMSATLDARAFSDYFGGAKAVWVRGRTHPVTVYNTAQPEDNYLDAALCATLQVKDATGTPVPPPSDLPQESVAPAASTGAMQPPTPQEGQAPDPAFINRRYLVFVGIVIGYTTFYLTRGSLTYSAPMMVADPNLGFNLTHIGMMTSIFPMAYGVSKFLAGVVSTAVSARLLLGFGLMATAAVNLAFGASSSLTIFCVLWGINGMLQGVGAPACANVLTRWFATKERGTYWGMWNIAHNLGGFLAPVIVGGCAKHFGWRWGMWAPGLIGCVIGLFILGAVRDKPTDLGFPAVDATTAAAAPAKDSKPKSSGGNMMSALSSVLKLPAIWALAFTYFCIYVVRQGVTSWLVFYLMAEKGAADAGSAALTVSGLELGGLAGSTVAGFLSDRAIRGAKEGTGLVGKRIKVVMAYTVGMAVALAGLQAVPAEAKPLQWLAIAALGFTIYGPQMLIGLAGAELVAPGAVGASQGILGWIAYLGAANAGIPLANIVQNYGWGGFFTSLWGACGVALLLLATVANAQSFGQRQEAVAKQAA